MSKTRFERAIVVGGTSGIGAALVDRLAAGGARVASLGRSARDGERADGVIERACDVRDTDRAGPLFDELAAKLGGVDLLVYSSGVLHTGEASADGTARDVDMIATNFAGLVAWCNAAAAHMRARGGGTIVGISSVAGDRGRKPYPVYGATKAASNVYLASLRLRLFASGVRVCTVRPGHVDTPMTRDVRKITPISAGDAARAILAAAERGVAVRYVPRRWWWISTVLRAIPEPIFRRLDF